MMNKKRWAGIIAAAVVGTMSVTGVGNSTVQAYFNRGTVGVSVGKGSVSVEAGSNTSVSVSLTPASDSQLPGCGMAECPQICGEKECLDANGQCTCNGKTYQTYYTSVSVSSSNTSVATASYSSGTLTVHGVSEGTAVITLTAALRQFSSGTTSVTVNVSKKPSSGDNNTSGGNNSSSSGSNTSGGNNTTTNENHTTSSSGSTGKNNNSTDKSATASQVGGDATTEETTEELIEENADGVTVVESDRGTITFVPIKDVKMGSEYLEAIQGKEKEYVDFQKKDDAGNIVYAWEFLGTDVKSVFDMDFSVTSGKTAFDGCKLFQNVQALYLRFAHDGKLPGKAKVFIKVPEDMQNGSKWYLYHYDGKKDSAEELAKELVVENGYVTIELEECYDCVLSDKEISVKGETVVTSSEAENETEAAPSNSSMVYIVAAIIIALAVGAVLFGKKKKQNETAEPVAENRAENNEEKHESENNEAE